MILKMETWIDVDKKLPPANKEVLVLCSGGTITHAHCIKKKKILIGWVYDLFTNPEASERVLMWRKLTPVTAHIDTENLLQSVEDIQPSSH